MNPEKQTFLNRLKNMLTLTSTQTYTRPQATTTAPVSYNLKDRGVQLTDSDLKELRNVLFAEVSNRDPEKQMFESRIIANTALNRIPQYAEKNKKMNLANVLMAPNQYQGYGSKEYNRFINNATTTENPFDQRKIQAIDSVINEIKSGNFKDTTDNSVFYVHDPKGRIWTKPGKLFNY